jgi:uncharacterized membrane protein
MATSGKPATAKTRLSFSALVGILVAIAVMSSGKSDLAPLIGWDTAALVFILWVWQGLKSMNAHETKQFAVREDPGRTSTEILLLGASLASLVAIVFLISQAGNSSSVNRNSAVFLSLVSVIVSWLVVQTVHILKYAKLYYDGTEGGIDFNQVDPPRYSDFAYLAFTMGMTFQVSDTALKTKELRQTALKHAMLSYVFGTVIIATTINTIASLGK